MRRCIVALTALLACILPLSAQQPKVLAPHRPIAPRLPDSLPTTAPPRSMVGGLWMIDANFKSTIYLRNDVEIAPVTVTPVLYLSNGKKVTLPDVRLEPSGTATINVNDALNQKGIAPWATLTGYVEIQYNWPWDPLCVTVTSVDTVHSVIFTNGLRPTLPTTPKEKAAAAKGPGTQTLEGMWWKQEPEVTGFVTLSNTTEQPMKAQLQVSDATAKPLGQHTVTVSPHGTKMVNLRELLAAAGTTGGLRVTYYGTANQLIINGGLQDQAVGYSASLPFAAIPPSPAKPSLQSYAELGLMSGAADPMMQFPAGTTFTPYSVLRNVSDQPATLTPSVYWMAGAAARSARLRPLTLSPLQTQSLDVPALLSAAGLPNFNGSFNLVFDVEGSVLMASGSVDQKNTYVFEVLPKAVLESASKNLAYWSTANGDDTMVTLWNPADEAQDFVFTLFFSGGHYDLPIHLEARATRMFNVSEIVQNQIPDKDGNLIPTNMHEGSARISGPHLADNEAILVATDAGVYNVRKATCGYICNNCNGVVSSSSTPSSFDLSLPSGQVQITFSDLWNTGVKHTLTSSATWSSSETTVATVSNGLTKAVAVGSTVIDGFVATDPWAGQQCGSPPPACPPDMGLLGESSGGVGPPQIKSISPNFGHGTAVSVTIKGSGFGTAGTVNFSGTGITVTYVTRSDSSISATFNTTNAPVGVQQVTVTNQTPSNPMNFQVTPATAVPVNFRLTSAQDVGNGDLDVTYVWDSSTGNKSDLSACTIGENVAYQTPPGVDYQPPSPPWPANSPYGNPTILSGPATSAGYVDHHWLGPGITGASFKKPYSASSFISNQYYWYECSGGNFIHWEDGLVITRSVSTNGSGGWKFLVSTTDTAKTATINPLP